MKRKIAAHDSGNVFLHIINLFRTYGGDCREMPEFPAPPNGYMFEIDEPIQTCHPVCGLGLDVKNGNSLPVGRYTVVECERDPCYARKLHLVRDDGERVWCYYGNDRNETMDWSGIKAVALSAAA